MRKTFLFMDTIFNKVDAKGRVSLPSDYRAIVKELSTEIVCYRSLTAPCIEGCTEELLDKLATEIENATDFFSETQDNLTNLIFGDAKRFTFGKGRKFQIWNPENWEKEEARIRAEALKNRPTLTRKTEGE